MSKVIYLDEQRPHLAGPCRCLDCKHEWQGVAPVGTWAMDCPKCGASKGARFSMIGPTSDTTFTCQCGNTFFWVVPDGGAHCPNCGLHHHP